MNYKIFVINLKKRTDRRKNVETIFKNANFEDYSFYEGFDGSEIKETYEMKQLFTDNDFGNRKGFIGCALSHYNLWIELIKDKTHDYYIIFEDDFTLYEKFNIYFENTKKIMNDNLEKIDFLLLGYHPTIKIDNSKLKVNVTLKKLDNDKYIGGFFSYIITKCGAKKIMNYIETNGIKHGVDYLLKIDSNLNCLELSPHIVYSDWVSNLNNSVDSNIQRDFSVFNFNTIFDYNNYLYIKGVDIINNDLIYINTNENKGINKLIETSNKIELCGGFNSLGFLKKNFDLNNIQKIEDFERNNHGLFIKLDKTISVKIICNWQSSQELCDEWNPMSKGDYRWNNIKLTSTNNHDEIDYYVIINKPSNNDEKYIPEKTIIFQMEPRCNNPNQTWGVKTWGDWADPDESKFLQVRNHKNYYNNCSWQFKTTYNQFLCSNPAKQFNHISTICSSKYFDPGHIKRVDFLKYIESKNDKNCIIDIFGSDNKQGFKNYKGALSISEKEKGILPYKYYFMVENNREYNYITEKLWEPLIAESLCFYWGAPNISYYINPLAYVQLDLDNFENSYQIIKNALNDDLYSKRINIIREEKYKLLNYYNFFPTIERIITTDLWKDNINSIALDTTFYIIEKNSFTNYKTIPFINSLKDLGLNIKIIKKIDNNSINLDHIHGNNFTKRLIYNNFIKYLKLDVNNISEIQMDKSNLDINKLSFLMTKYHLYEEILKTNTKNHVIIDNDLILNCSFNKLLYHILYLPNEYDVCQLTESINNKFKYTSQVTSYYYEVKKYFFDNSNAIVVSKKGIEKMLKYSNNFILDYYNNVIYECYENIKDFKFYAVKESIFI